MSVSVSPAIRLTRRADTPDFSVSGIDLHDIAGPRAPVTVLDEFRVTGRPFPPHPHAGFSAVTYVLPGSAGGLRSRDSLGHDITVGPGGIVWTEAGHGLLHHEVPSDPDKMLHGLQIFVNASARAKLGPPRLLWLDGAAVPIHRDGEGVLARVVVGEFGGVRSPLEPTEPFTLLDVDLTGSTSFALGEDQFATVYARSGRVELGAGHSPRTLQRSEIATLHGGADRISIEALDPANVLILVGLEIRDPVVAHGPFIMNSEDQIRDAAARYTRGAMGSLPALAND
ncbi:pirin family protein [Segnochrobactrum spirostomi]|uniref:pirin family protein n=1 Tax=Segnochrobactrum spirostomi TaxID=2608987 RepID=UPI001AD7EC44|nr:pirin family protein [Segnochrobactrum spirostomi]